MGGGDAVEDGAERAGDGAASGGEEEREGEQGVGGERCPGAWVHRQVPGVSVHPHGDQPTAPPPRLQEADGGGIGGRCAGEERPEPHASAGEAEGGCGGGEEDLQKRRRLEDIKGQATAEGDPDKLAQLFQEYWEA